jgi:cell division protein FtsI (penicillin-binding protein 3)
VTASNPRVKAQTPGLGPGARRRAYAIAALVSVLLAGIAMKAWALQVEGADRFKAQAQRQHQRTIEIAAPRGAILDTRGRALAVTADADSVFANPRKVIDVAGTADRLAGLLGLDVRVVEARLASAKQFVWLARRVTPEQAASVRAAKLAGIEITQEPRRWYPSRSSGGTIIGVSGIDGEGLEGLELSMDKVLRGQRATFAALRDAPGKTIAADGIVEAAPGAAVSLTIDRSIQHVADEALMKAIATHQAKSGVVIVLDVATSHVLAMASWPTFDPNAPGAHADARNRGVTDVYEIGSVMKVFTVAAALDAGATRPDEMWDVERGRYTIGRKTIRDVHPDWQLSTGGILKRSSNVGAVKVAQRIGRERLYEALRTYGFGTKTGIELPGEQGGVVRDGRKWREIELATISYGYGLTVTPLQLVAGIAAIGNDGLYTAPRIVAHIDGADGRVLYQHHPETRRIMKSETAAALLPMLASVFEGGTQAGTAHSVVIPGFAVGGKSGTAHKIDRATGTYDRERYLSSFAGLAPIDRPRIAVVAIVDEPRGGDYYGGRVAGPVFAEVVSHTLRYLGVPGSPPPPPPPPTGKGKKAPAPEPVVVEAIPPTEEPVALDDLDDATVRVPDFAGMGMAEAVDAAGQAGVALVVEGSGRAAAQDPPPGKVPVGTTVTVRFEGGGSRRLPTVGAAPP